MKRETKQTKYLEDYIQDLKGCIDRIDRTQISAILDILDDARDRQWNIWVIGNGGSALTASHFATDLGKGASVGRRQRFRVQALTESVGIITAMGNDIDFDDIFVEQLKNQAQSDDVLVIFSGSGSSENVLRAARWSRKNRLTVVGITGQSGGQLPYEADCVWKAASDHMGRIEDMHMIAAHILSYFFIEEELEDAERAVD